MNVNIGDRVSAKATLFDKKGKNKWSKAVFGRNYKNAQCTGIVTKIRGKIATVIWDIDKEEMPVDITLLRKTELSSEQQKSSNTSRYQFSSSSSSSSSSTDSDEVNDHRDESEVNMDVSETPDDVTTVHDTTWICNQPTVSNSYKDGKYKPKVHNTKDLHNMSELDFWLLFFPIERISLFLEATNKNMKPESKRCTQDEFMKIIGILYAMSLQILPKRRDYWATKEGKNNIYPPAAFGQRFNMGYHRFETILQSMSFHTVPDSEDEDRWLSVRSFIDALHEKWNGVISPGYKVCIDESMFAWYGRGSYDINGMPAVIKIKRKPKGIGCECKTLADASSKILLRLEINEGKNTMATKKWQNELGAGTATTLRLTEPWQGTERIVVGDSWFSSVKTAVELRKRGLHFVGLVKTATKQYPIKKLREICPKERGSSIVAKAVVNGYDLVAAAWRDKKVHTFVSTCGTTLPGNPAKKRRCDDEGRPYEYEIPRINLVEEYFEGAPAIDVHNHIRQAGLALEEIWGTQNWKHRIYASLFGIMETNAYLAFKYFKKNEEMTHTTFTQNLAYQIIHKNWDAQVKVPKPFVNETSSLSSDHRLVALSSVDERKRVQRKCVICSRIHHKQMKASYFCISCGPDAVICAPTTGRECFAYHVINGIPIR